MKIVILQPVPYRRPEGALAQYHGAIWAEELRRRGHDATKMVLGNPKLVQPDSPLLSVSTKSQRTDPAFWHNANADLVLSYGGFSSEDLRIALAVKTGSPKTRFVARIEGNAPPRFRSVRASLADFPGNYTSVRHCPTESFEREKTSAFRAFLRASFRTIRSLATDQSEAFVPLAETADAVTLFFPHLVEKAKHFLREKGRTDLLPKVRWCGYPVRPVFSPPSNGRKTPQSVVAVANWRHFKDPELTADAMSIVLRERPAATFTVVGTRSFRVADRILATIPSAAPRVHAFEHVDNRSLPNFIANAQVFLLCSHREGIPSVLSEALCCGCSLALSTGPAVGAFKSYLSDGECGTQSGSRSPRDMADAVLRELELWRSGRRSGSGLAANWEKTRVENLCDDLLGCNLSGI